MSRLGLCDKAWMMEWMDGWMDGLDGCGEQWARDDHWHWHRNRRTAVILLLLLQLVLLFTAVLYSSEGDGPSLVALPACLCEEDIELLIVGTLAAKLPGSCLDDGEILFECVEDLAIADVLLVEDGLVLLSALFKVVLGELTSEGHCGGCGG